MTETTPMIQADVISHHSSINHSPHGPFPHSSWIFLIRHGSRRNIGDGGAGEFKTNIVRVAEPCTCLKLRPKFVRSVCTPQHPCPVDPCRFRIDVVIAKLPVNKAMMIW